MGYLAYLSTLILSSALDLGNNLDIPLILGYNYNAKCNKVQLCIDFHTSIQQQFLECVNTLETVNTGLL